MSGSPVVAVDPGREKCGLARVSAAGDILHTEVVPTDAIVTRVLAVLVSGDELVVGSGTGSAPVREALLGQVPSIEPIIVEETGSTEQARTLYFELNPPRGLWRLVPRGLQFPPVPVDDLAAVILARRHLQSRLAV